MNTHKNARLTYLRRLEMVRDLTEGGLSASEAGCKHGVSAVTARKWLGRCLADGAAGLLDKSSRPALPRGHGDRKRGHSMIVEQYAPGMTAMAAPVLGKGREAIAVITIAGPLQRLTPQHGRPRAAAGGRAIAA